MTTREQHSIDERLARLVGRRLSPVSKLTPLIELFKPNSLFVSDAQVAHPVRLGGAPVRPLGGRGQGTSVSNALNGAIGEALERHGATCVPDAELIEGTWDELSGRLPLVSLDDLRLFSDEQLRSPGFTLRNIGGSDRLSWMAGTRFDTSADGSPIYYPLERLSLYREGAERFDVSTTNGFALHVTWERAFKGALCEVLERDAFLTHWWLRRAAPLYTHDVIATAVAGAARTAVDWMGERISILDLTACWGVPVFIALSRGRPGTDEPALAVAGAAGESAIATFEKCILESTRIFLELHATAPKLGKVKPTEPFDRLVQSFEDVALLYWHADAARHADFLFTGPRLDADALAAALALPDVDPLEAVRSRGARVFAFDMTPVDLRLAGLSLARVVIPEAIPLNCAHVARPFGCAKLRALSIAELNPMPHPLV